MTSVNEKTLRVWAFPAILLLAFALRITGLGYGLPHVYHQDEPMIVNNAVAIGHDGWNTRYFVIPPFVSYCLFVLYGIYFAFGRLIGLFAGVDDFALSFFRDPTPFYWIGRSFIGVFFGTATVAAVYAIGRRFFSERTAVLSAALLAVFPFHVQHGHYIYADVPLAFAVAFLFYRLLLLAEEPSGKNYAWMGAVFGWAVGVKYTAAYFLPAVLAAHHFARPGTWISQKAWKSAGISAVAALAAFFVTAPYTFLDWAAFWSAIERQSGAQIPTGWLHHLSYSIAGGTAIFVPLLSATGYFRIMKNRRPIAWVLGAGALSYYVVSVYFSQHYARYMLPLVPILTLTAGEGLGWIGEFLGPKRRVFFASLAILSLLVPAAYSNYLFMKKDTRTMALEWFEAETSQKTRVAFANRFFSPRLTQSREQLLEKLTDLKGARSEGRRAKLELEIRATRDRKPYEVYSLLEPGAPEPDFMVLKPFVAAEPEALRAAGIRYVVFNRSELVPAFEALKENGGMRLVRSFSPYRGDPVEISADRYDSTAAPHLPRELFRRSRLGPYLEVYEVLQGSSQ